MLPSHRRAIADIIACRTEALGADLWCCPKCGTLVSVFHSCKNRHCGQCNGARTQAWLEQRQAEILPTPYFHVTVTPADSLAQTPDGRLRHPDQGRCPIHHRTGSRSALG